MTAIHDLTLADLCRRLKSGELSAANVTAHMLARIDERDGSLRAYVRVLRNEATAAAARLDEARVAGKPLGALHGVPIAVKDLVATKGIATTCGTKVLANWIPDADATIVQRLHQAGAVIIGKVKLTEGAFSSHHPEVEAPRNPWNAAHWTGVSSSGSGASIAGRLAFGAIGTDTGGSIRFPSAACGIVGLKPTYGRVSRHGVFPLADSLDHIGPMTRTVEDAARMLGVLAGHDPKDATSLHDAVPNYVAACDGGVVGLRVGVDWSYVETGVDAAVVATIKEALAALQALGAEVVEVKLPDYASLVQGWGITCGAECALAHAPHYPAKKSSYGPELARLLDLGAAAAATAYAHLERERERFRAGLDAVLAGVDVLIAPCMVSLPPTIASMAQAVASESGTADFITFTAPFNYSGHPSLTLPAGVSSGGLPKAFQLIGRRLAEPTLLRAGHAYEATRGPIVYPR
ncbi:MAG: amidase [Gammaproteobacteria bacterium]|nr:amidase [Gammaproteobacteria bacterium]